MEKVRVISSKFIKSSKGLDDSPDFGLSEVVFLGRSNVGKSSLINSITNHSGLAKSSSTPGKTRLINFFEVIFQSGDQKIPIIFVDLPGFGYAKVSKNLQDEWERNLDIFLKNRPRIKTFIHLIDSRHVNLQKDENLGLYLSKFISDDQRILSVYTKSDKLNQSQKSAIFKMDKNAILVSSSKRIGIESLICSIFNSVFGINDDF